MARLPITTLRKDIDVRVVLGQSIFDLYQQIQHTVQRETPALSHFFAQPIINAVKGEINWNTRLVGSIKPAKDFSPAEWQTAREKLKDYQAQIEKLIQEFDKPGKKHPTATQALRSMLMTPDLNDSLFQVGNDLVLTQWGCYKYGTGAQSADLFEQIDKQNRHPTPATDNPPADEPEKVEKQPAGIQHISQETPAVEEKAPPPEEPSKNQPPIAQEQQEEIQQEEEQHVTVVEEPFFWRWLLLLILLLLFLFGLMWHFWKTHGVQSEVALKAEVAALWDAVDKKAKECGLPPFQRPAPPQPEKPVPTGNDKAPQEVEDRRAEKNVNPNAKVNVSLTWNDTSDLDLLIDKEPMIKPITPGKKYQICDPIDCGIKDVDANFCESGSDCNLTNRPLENFTWVDHISPGHYQFFVKLHSTNKPKSEIVAIPFEVSVTKDGKSQTYKGVIEPREITCEKRCSAPNKFVTEFTIDASSK